MRDTVLIVDEDVNAQIIAETLLQLRGFDVRLANSTAEACEILSRGDVGVILMDMQGAGIEGLQQLRAAAASAPSRPRVVVMTQRQEPELTRFAERLRVDAVLRKPMQPGRFIATVEELAEGGAPNAA